MIRTKNYPADNGGFVFFGELALLKDVQEWQPKKFLKMMMGVMMGVDSYF